MSTPDRRPKVYTPLFAGVYWEVQDTLLEDVERIEVISGASGTIWGPNAVKGVVNISTKSAKDTHGALVSVGGGSLDQGSLARKAMNQGVQDYLIKGDVTGKNLERAMH